jgi:hypothetical protein
MQTRLGQRVPLHKLLPVIEPIPVYGGSKTGLLEVTDGRGDDF